MADAPKQKLVNGKPVDDEIETDTSPTGDSQPDDGEPSAEPDNETGDTEEPGSVGFTPPDSVSDIKKGVTDRIDRIKKEGPEPFRQAAKGLVDKLFDAVDGGFDRWFGDKK